MMMYARSKARALPISFQPELGSASCPTYASLRKFLSPKSLEKFPSKFSSESSSDGVDSEWHYHNWLSFSTPNETWRPLCPGGLDHVYNLGSPATTEEYAQAAQVAQLSQFQALFEGFLEYMWEFYSAVIMWKSQSPWPVFRGAFYDSWLAPTGGFYGVRRALGGAAADGAGVLGTAHVQLNLQTWAPTIIVRGPGAVHASTALAAPTKRGFAEDAQEGEGGSEHSGLGANVIGTLHVIAKFYTLKGVEAGAPTQWDLPEKYAQSIPGQAVVKLATPLQWPRQQSASDKASAPVPGPLLIKLELVASSATAGTKLLASATTVQSNPATAVDFTAFGPLRSNQAEWLNATMRIEQYVDGGATAHRRFPGERHASPLKAAAAESSITVTLALPSTASHALFYAELQLVDLTVPSGGESRILPVWWSDNYVTLLPGEQVTLTAHFDHTDVAVGAYLAVKLGGWNANPVVAPLE